MSERSYLAKLRPSDGTRVEVEGALLQRFERLNEQEWVEFLEDLAVERPEAFEVLSPDRPESLTLHAKLFLSRLGPATQRLIAQALERVLRQQLGRLGGIEEAEPLLELLYLATSAPGISLTPLLMELTSKTDLGGTVRTAAAKALVAHATTVPLSFWQGVDLATAPELATAVLSGLGVSSPRRALESLAVLPLPPPHPENLEPSLRMVLRRLLADEDGLNQLRELRRTARDWFRSVLDTVLGFREFTSVRLLLEPGEEDESAVRQRLAGALERYLTGVTDELPWGQGAEGTQEASPGAVSVVESAVRRWRPFEVHDEEYSLRLLALLRTHHSLRILAALVSFLEGVLVERLDEEPWRRDSVLVVARRALEVLETMRTAVRMVVAGASEQDRAIWMSYYRCLRLSLAHPELASSALRQLVAHTAVQDELQVTILYALEQDHISGEECLDVLRHYYHESTYERILARTLNFARSTRELSEEIPDPLKRAGVKLYLLNPSYVAGPECKLSAMDKVLIEHEAVERSFSRWSEELVPAELLEVA